MNASLNKSSLHEGLFEEVENNIKELHEHDVKVNNLMLNKIVKLRTENKMFKEINEELTIQLRILQKSLKTAQNRAECLKKSYQNLQSKNEELLDYLEVTKKVKKDIVGPVTKSGEISFDKTHDDQSCFEVEGNVTL